MKITILNGDMSGLQTEFSKNLEVLASRFRQDHTVKLFPLQQMKLHYCTGCWNCWWKTPGECAIQDDAADIFSAVIHSDFVIFASPLMAGFTSSALKKITDRLIVLLHPYVELKNGECHHRKRYSKYPDFGVLLQKEDDTDEEDIEIVNTIYDRLSLNFHNTKKYLEFIDNYTIEKIFHDTCNN